MPQLNSSSSFLIDTYRFTKDILPKHFKAAAVLIVVELTDCEAKVLMTKRSDKLRTHPGEICFPGGKLEAGETLLQAALRETKEEIGVSICENNIVGQLDDAWSRTGYHMTAFVALVEKLPHFSLSSEVDKIVVFNTNEPFNVSYIERNLEAYKFMEPIVNAGDNKIVSATADLLLELLEALQGEYYNRGKKRLRLLNSIYSAN